ncbi:MAG: 50S ribosomal protein L4 [Candidatus Omnitrophota bacterium]|nr:MAG: 50S ribosomal protein L4 [Candidatus Omnitrophota bacterium]
MKGLSLYNIEGKQIGEVKVDEEIFDGQVNKPLLQEVLNIYARNKRQGSASVKTRAEVRGGGKKPWRQKGTGRARAGTINSPLWRGGGVVFGPHPRDFSTTLPKKMKRKALLSALNLKIKEDQVLVVDKIEIKQAKTKEWAKILSAFNIKERCLVLLNMPNKEIERAGRNIPHLCIECFKNVNAEQICCYHKLIIEKDALDKLTERIRGKGE